ncbi:MAG TPA: gluconate 2-dehydrogenase subunit 3 family protein [Chloroflexota bacterium]|nr:gluconate 2-dehydrogenase subunit 3 family protein [Chloroflexota bacterium]
MAARDTLAVFVEALVPTDDTPGAAEARTAAAVRAALAERPPLAALVEQGLRALDRAGERLGGQPFAALAPTQRHALMTLLARGSPPPGWTAADPPPEVFWATLRGLAVGLFYGSPLGHQLCGFPGPCVDSGGYAHTIVEPDPRREPA